MAFVISIIEHTPPFVWVILALLVYRGVQNMRTRWLSLTALLTPAGIFIVLGVVASSVRSATDALAWAAMLALALPAGFFTAPTPLAVDRRAGRLQIRGSAVFAARILVIFVVRYGLAVATVLHPDRARALHLATSLFSGLVAGYYVGWSVSLWRAYRRAPPAGLAA